MAAPTQNFADRFHSGITSRYGDAYSVEIRQDDYTGAVDTGPEIIDLRIDYGARGKSVGLIPSRVSVEYFDPHLSLGNLVSTASARELQLIVKKGNNIIWTGYILPSSIEQRISKRGRFVQIEATDGSSFLNDYLYDGPVDTRIKLSQVFYLAFRQINTDASTQRLNNLLTPYATPPIEGNEALSDIYLDTDFLEGRTWRDIVETLLARFGLIACNTYPGFVVFDTLAAFTDFALDRVDEDGDRVDGVQDVAPIPDTTYELLDGAAIQADPNARRVEVVWNRGYDKSLRIYDPNVVRNPFFDSNINDWGRSNDAAQGDVIWSADDGGVMQIALNRTGSDTPTRYAFQDVALPAGEKYLGTRFSVRSRWYIMGEDDDAAVTNTKTQYALRFTGSGNPLWWDATNSEWTETETHNVITPAGSFVTFTTEMEPLHERGTLQIRLYEGVDARILNQPHIESYQWDNVFVQPIQAEEQDTTIYTYVEDTSLKAGVISRLGAFDYGSAATGDFARMLTRNELGNVRANNFQVGRYNAGELATGWTLDVALARHTLHRRSDLVLRLQARAKMDSGDIVTPLTPIIYNGERYLFETITTRPLERTIRFLGIRIKHRPLAHIEHGLFSEEQRQVGRGGLHSGGSGTPLPDHGVGVLWRSGGVAQTYAIAEIGAPGQLLGVIDGDPDYVGFVEPGSGIPMYGVAQAGRVLKVNDMGQTVWGVDEVGATGNTVPDFSSDDNGKVLAIVSGALDFVTDQDTTYIPGVGMHLDTDTNTFSVLRPLPSVSTDDIGKILKVNADGDGYSLGTDANTTYVGGQGIKLTPVDSNPDKFEVDLANNSGLQFNSDKLRVKIANGIMRTSSGVGAKAYTGITVDSNGIAVTEPYTAAERTKLAAIEANATADQTGPEIVGLLEALADNARLAYSAIKGTPMLATVAVSGSYDDLTGKPSIPAPTTSLPFTAITGVLADSQIPDGIARDTELPSSTLLGRIPSANPGNNKVWKTNGSGVTAWRDDKDTTYTAGTGLTLTGTTFKVTRPFTSADESKLDAIEAGATADQTGAEMVTALTALSGTARLGYAAIKDTPTIPSGAKLLPAAPAAGTSTSGVYVLGVRPNAGTNNTPGWNPLSDIVANSKGLDTFDTLLNDRAVISHIGVVAGTGITVDANGVSVTEPYTANERTRLAALLARRPNNVSNLTTSNITNTTVNVSWSAGAKVVARYWVAWYEGETLIESITTTDTSYQITGLTQGTTYEIRVFAENAIGTSPQPTTATATTANRDSQSITLGAGQVTDQGGTLSWGDIDALIDSALTGINVDIYLRVLLFRNSGTCSMSISRTAGGSTTTTREDLTTTWESAPDAIVITAGALTITIPGPAHSSSRTSDSTEPYNWIVSTAKRNEIATFIIDYHGLPQADRDGTTLTLQA